MLRQWREATANCPPIVSHCAEQGKHCELERSGEKSEREAVFILQAFLSFPVRLCCLCVCEPALLSVGTISLRAWRVTDVAGLYCCFPPAPTVPPLIHRESNPIIWQDTQKHTTLPLFKGKVAFIHPPANWSGMCLFKGTVGLFKAVALCLG